jgi:hypothetical protein
MIDRTNTEADATVHRLFYPPRGVRLSPGLKFDPSVR